MNETDFLATPLREAEHDSASRLFAFFRVRPNTDDTRFAPGAGTRLRFANKAADTLQVVGVPCGFFVPGDKVVVKYKNVKVFVGDLDSISRNESRGTAAADNAAFSGPWATMSRLVYRQNRMAANGSGGTSYTPSSRLVLNEDQHGLPQNLNSELYEISNHGATPCGYTVAQADVSVSTQQLPYDECRDITVADAIRRELRFFPRTVVRFDYSGASPALHITRIGTTGSDAAYLASVPKTARRRDYDAHPITGVDLEIETVASGYRTIDHQHYGNTQPGNPDCLYATLQLAGAEGSTVTQSITLKTEAVPSNLNDKTWWKQKHKVLEKYTTNQITITDGARKDKDGNTVPVNSPYEYICANTAGELEAAGILCRVEQFSCKVKVDDGHDKEEEILLTANFLTTNKTGKKTWVVSSESTAGETVPEGLAQAILADRSGALRGVKLALRLGDALPTLGDLCEGLPLQSYEVDCASLVAELEFGAPEHLSPEDMAALLSGFRNKCRAHTAFSRNTGKPADDNKNEVELGGIPPLSSTEWSPGKTTKKTIHAAAQSGSGTIELDPSSLDSGSKVEIHDLTVGENTYKVLADDDIKIPAPGGSSVVTDGKSTEFIPHDNTQGANNDDEGKLQIYGFKSAATAAATANEGGTLAARLAKDTDASAMAVPVKTSGGLIQWIKLGQIAKMTLVEGTNITLTTSQDGKSIVISASATPNVTGATRTLLLGGPVSYDPSTHYLTQPVYSLVISGGLVTSITVQTSVTIQAVEETT